MARIRCDFRSEELDMGTSMTVFLPENLNANSVDVVYLLHGLADNCTGWSRYTSVERYARAHNVAVVMPEVQRSFYSNMKFGLSYFDFIHTELPVLCSRLFNLTDKREKRYIMGLSMGGYGALKCVLNSPLRYAGCAAFSAVTDIEAAVKECDGQRRSEYKAMFGEELFIPGDCNLFDMLKSQRSDQLPRFYLACGRQDGLLGQNEKFVDLAVRKGASCKFETWDGLHDWNFWDMAVKRAFDFFFG